RSLDIGRHYRLIALPPCGGGSGWGVSAIITARMANTQSAKKRVRASLRKRDRNRSTRSAVKTLVSRARRPPRRPKPCRRHRPGRPPPPRSRPPSPRKRKPSQARRDDLSLCRSASGAEDLLQDEAFDGEPGVQLTE